MAEIDVKDGLFRLLDEFLYRRGRLYKPVRLYICTLPTVN